MKSNRNDAGDRSSKYVSFLKSRISKINVTLSKSHQTIRSVTALLSSNIAATLLTAIGGILVARFLGPEITGEFRAFTIPLTYLTFLHLGTWDGVLRQIPYYVGKDKPEKVDELAAAAGAFNLLVSVIISIGFFVYAAYSLANRDLVGFFGWLSQVFACWLLFYGSYLSSTYRTLHHFVAVSKIQVSQAIVTFGMVFLLPFLKFYGLAIRVIVPAILGVFLFHRYRPLTVKYHLDIKTLQDIIKIGLPFSFWGNLYTSVWLATESALILSLGGISSLGLFSVAIIIRSAINSFPIAIMQVLTPRVVTNLAKEGSIRKANVRIAWVTIGLVGCMLVLAYTGSILLEYFVPYFIPKYIDGIPLMKVCLWFSVIEAAFLPINILFATGRPWLYGRSVIAGIIVFPLATWLLIPVIGGVLAVIVGSLLGRSARTLAAYVDLVLLTRQEEHDIRNKKT